MNILRRIFGLETRDDESEKTNEEFYPEVSDELLRSLVQDTNMTPEKALEIPAFSAAVEFIADTVAMLPVKLFREDKSAKTTEEITDDRRLFLLNDEANPTMSAFDVRAAQLRDMMISGAGFIYVDRSAFGGIRSLRYVKRSDISIMKNSDPIFKEFNILVGGKRYLPFEFLIMTRNSEDGVTGAGAVSEHKTLLSAMYQALKYESRNAGTGGSKKGFLQSERKLGKPEMDELRTSWQRLYANNEDNMMILNSGVKYQAAASTSAEMQLNESKQQNSEQIAEIFGLSPKILSGSCTTQEYMSAVRTSVLPVVERYQAALNRALLLESEKGEYYFALDTSELLKGDMLTRYQAYEVALRSNFLQLDEVRYMEDMPAIGFDFIKLGLNDVLFDPKTKTVYTPNTNALTPLESGNNDLTNDEKNDIIEERKKTNWVKGSKGRFAGSVPMGGASPSGANKFEVREFQNKQKLNNHWQNGRTHQLEYAADGITTKEAYVNRALELLESPTGNGILGHMDKSGNIIRYDTAKNDFAKGNPQKGIKTMFKPISGRKYYDAQKEEDLKHGGKE